MILNILIENILSYKLLIQKPNSLNNLYNLSPFEFLIIDYINNH